MDKIPSRGICRKKYTGLIEKYKPEQIKYEVDHIVPLAILWKKSGGWNNIAGNNTNDMERYRHMSDPTNLQVVTKEFNSAKSSAGENYDRYVKPDFTSKKAEGGIKGALKFNGKPFQDAAGNPLRR